MADTERPGLKVTLISLNLPWYRRAISSGQISAEAEATQTLIVLELAVVSQP